MKKDRKTVSLSEKWLRYGRNVCICMLAMFLACNMTGCGQMGEALEADMEAEAVSDDSRHAVACSVTLTEGKYSEEKLDDEWEEETSVQIKLDKDKITVDAPADKAGQSGESAKTDQSGVKITDSQAVITQEGTYVLSGTLEDGQIIVDADKKELVRLVLNGVDLNCSSSAPIYSKGGNVVVILAEGTENSVTDGTEYIYEEGEDEPRAAIFAKDDLTFNGTGTLSVTGNYNHAIQCKDDLKFITGTYVIKAAGDGIVGKDSITVRNGNFTVESGGDGLKATNTEESDKGYILIEKGSFEICSGGDGMQAETLLRVNNGNIEITSGGGSQNASGNGEMPPGNDRPGKMPEGDPAGSKFPAEGQPDGVPEEGWPDGVTGEGQPDREATDGGQAGEGQPEGETADSGQPGEGQPEGETVDSGQSGEGRSGERMTPPDGMPDKMPEGEATEGVGADRKVLPEGEAVEGAGADGKVLPEGEAAEGAGPDGKISPNGHTNGSEESSAAEPESAKGLKSYVELIIAGGEFDLDSCDDAIHSNQNVTIRNGSFIISTGDDGIHADQTLTVEGGDIDIRQSYEGLEGYEILIEEGDVKITANDDGINAAGNDDSANNPEADQDTSQDSNQGTKTEWNKGGPMAEEDQGASLTINGGTIYVNADGDGIDANGEIYMNGGDITVHGPVSGGNGTLDYASVCKITGGTFVGIGSAGMAQNPSEDSTQPVIVWKMDSSVEAGSVISVKDSEGRVMIETAAKKAAQWFAISSPDFVNGGTYRVCVGGTEKEVSLDPEQSVTEVLP